MSTCSLSFYKADRCFDLIPVYFKDILTYDPITRQTYNYATPIACDKNPRNIIELDPDDQDFHILGQELIKRKPPLMFTPSQIKTTIRPNTFTTQDASIYSNAELDQFWNKILFSELSDSTLQLVRKLLVIPSFHLIHLTMMQIHLMKIFTLHYVLAYMKNSKI